MVCKYSIGHFFKFCYLIKVFWLLLIHSPVPPGPLHHPLVLLHPAGQPRQHLQGVRGKIRFKVIGKFKMVSKGTFRVMTKF